MRARQRLQDIWQAFAKLDTHTLPANSRAKKKGPDGYLRLESDIWYFDENPERNAMIEQFMRTPSYLPGADVFDKVFALFDSGSQPPKVGKFHPKILAFLARLYSTIDPRHRGRRWSKSEGSRDIHIESVSQELGRMRDQELQSILDRVVRDEERDLQYGINRGGREATENRETIQVIRKFRQSLAS